MQNSLPYSLGSSVFFGHLVDFKCHGHQLNVGSDEKLKLILERKQAQPSGPLLHSTSRKPDQSFEKNILS